MLPRGPVRVIENALEWQQMVQAFSRRYRTKDRIVSCFLRCVLAAKGFGPAGSVDVSYRGLVGDPRSTDAADIEAAPAGR